MWPALAPPATAEAAAAVRETEAAVGTLAAEGLRTLVIGQRRLSTEQAAAWSAE